MKSSKAQQGKISSAKIHCASAEVEALLFCGKGRHGLVDFEHYERRGVKYSNNSDTCLVSLVPGKQGKYRAIDVQQEVFFPGEKERHGSVVNSPGT